MEDLLVDMADAGVVAQDPETCRLNTFQKEAMVGMLKEYDDEYLERQMDEALAQYNDSVDLGNDPVASGRQLGLRRVWEANAAMLPDLPPESGGSAWTLLYVILGLIAFTYLYRYLTRR